MLDKVTNYKKVAEQAVPKWDAQQAQTIFEQMYTQAGGKIDGVLRGQRQPGQRGDPDPQAQQP